MFACDVLMQAVQVGRSSEQARLAIPSKQDAQHDGLNDNQISDNARSVKRGRNTVEKALKNAAVPEFCDLIFRDAAVPENLPLPLGCALLSCSLALLPLECCSRVFGQLLTGSLYFPFGSLTPPQKF